MEVGCQVRVCQDILVILTSGEQVVEPTIVEVILEASSQPLPNKTFHKTILANQEDLGVQGECILAILDLRT